MQLNESLTDTLIIYVMVKKLLKPWKEWEAYKLGIIDEHGNKIKTPKTAKERAAWTLLDRFVWKIKKILSKFVGENKLMNMFAIAYLLKENFKIMAQANEKYIELLNEGLKEISAKEMKALYELKKIFDQSFSHHAKIFFDVDEEFIIPILLDIQKLLESEEKIKNLLDLNNILENENEN